MKKPNSAAPKTTVTAPAPAPTQEGDVERVLTVSVDEVVASPFQPRRIFADEQIAELAESIRERGIIQPLVVRRVDGKYELIAGERRLRAARSIGLAEVRVVVHEASDLEVAELALIENLQREDLTPIEEAEQYKLLQTRFGMKQELIAQHVGKSRTVVANMIRLLELEPEVRQMLASGTVSVGHAKVLLQLKDSEVQVEAAVRVVEKKLTVRQTEQLVRDALNPPAPKPEAEEAKALPESYARACEQLSQNFATKVNIASKGKSNGVIEIAYTGKDELARLLQIFGLTTAL